jgi:hypothetical protein
MKTHRLLTGLLAVVWLIAWCVMVLLVLHLAAPSTTTAVRCGIAGGIAPLALIGFNALRRRVGRGAH